METFDLARIYGAAENVKNARFERQYKQDYLKNLTSQEQRHWAELNDKQQFQQLYTTLQAVKAMPEPQQVEWLKSQPIGQDPRFSNAPPRRLLEALEAGVMIGLGKSPQGEPGDITMMRYQGIDTNDPSAVRTEVLRAEEAGRRPLVEVNTGDKLDMKAAEKLGELTATQYAGIVERGQAAGEKLGTLRALQNNPAITGPTQDFQAGARSFFAELGVPIAEHQIAQISNLAQYKGMLNQLVLAEQLKQKGPQTENDSKRIMETFAKTTNLAEANALILNYQVALAEREVELAQLAEAYKEQNNGDIDGFNRVLREYMQKTPLAANNPKSGRLVFWSEFRDRMRFDNPSMSDDEIMDLWRSKYGGR